MRVALLLLKFKADAIRPYFNFSSTAFVTLLNASLTFDASGKLPCARLGRPPPRPPMAVMRSPAFSPRLTRSSVKTAITVVPVAKTAMPLLGIFLAEFIS